MFAAGQGAETARVVELGSLYVVPPYGDAHQHMLDGPVHGPVRRLALCRPRRVLRARRDQPGPEHGARSASRFEGPGSIDVAYTHGGWTSTGSHPGPLYEGVVARNAAFDGAAPRTDSTAWSLLGDAYWFVNAAEDVGPQWDRFLRDAPDAVKVYLGDVAAGLDKGDMRGHGLRPEVLAEIVRRARAAGLPVYAHVDTADDVRLALDAGVDAFAHLPHRAAGRDPDGPIWLDAATVRPARPCPRPRRAHGVAPYAGAARAVDGARPDPARHAPGRDCPPGRGAPRARRRRRPRRPRGRPLDDDLEAPRRTTSSLRRCSVPRPSSTCGRA